MIDAIRKVSFGASKCTLTRRHKYGVGKRQRYAISHEYRTQFGLAGACVVLAHGIVVQRLNERADQVALAQLVQM